MATRDEVESFLRDFQQLAKAFDIIIIDREINEKALRDLGLTAINREEIILNLKSDNYYRGPTKDKDRPIFMVWEFGYELEDYCTIYIKLSTRKERSHPICLSFHKAVLEITYPLRNA